MTPESDFMDQVLDWLSVTHGVSDETGIEMVAGLAIGLALAVRTPAYATAAHRRFGEDYRQRAAGGDVLFQAMAVASGDERTSAEKMADELIEACPLPT